MLGKQYISYDSDDISRLSSLVFPLQVLTLFPVTPSSFFPFLSLYKHSIISKYFSSEFMARRFFMKYDNTKPSKLAANPSVHIYKSEGAYQSFIYLSIYWVISFYFPYPNVYTLISSVMVEIQIARICPVPYAQWSSLL